MEKIELKFSAQESCSHISIVVVMTLDEKGKNYTTGYYDRFMNEPLENADELPPLPKHILDAFTENAINKILSKDEIPNESDMIVKNGYMIPDEFNIKLDGCWYEITITKGNMRKIYYADETNIQTYPLLRHLADLY